MVGSLTPITMSEFWQLERQRITGLRVLCLSNMTTRKLYKKFLLPFLSDLLHSHAPFKEAWEMEPNLAAMCTDKTSITMEDKHGGDD